MGTILDPLDLDGELGGNVNCTPLLPAPLTTINTASISGRFKIMQCDPLGAEEILSSSRAPRRHERWVSANRNIRSTPY